ncbi:hypothetical protein CUMW_020470 [Citrus unshiu]|nr:hypothetical protein CUMW_020470 [Citrus unshiu]
MERLFSSLFSSLFIILFILSINLASSYATTTTYNVLSFGAKGNGVTDSTQAFAKAWAAACASTESATINITNCTIKTGDDCIPIGPGTKNLWIERVTCGPGHGISNCDTNIICMTCSIGSLAKDLVEEGVQNVTVFKTVFTGTTNGFRIKPWARPSNGFVQGVRFIDAVMRNVQFPIVIDQNYCPHNLNCPGQVSGVKISDVIYQDIRGTSATPIAIKFDSQSSCNNVIGKVLGLVQPNTCASTESATIYVPKGRYLLGSVAFKGECKSSDITFRIDGTLVAPADYSVLGRSDNWLSFEGVSSVSIIGGALDAKGSSLWACEAAGRNSPNTDGIHVQLSTNGKIMNCTIKTGDDCIPVGPGTKNFIGSLGKDMNDEGGQNVTNVNLRYSRQIAQSSCNNVIGKAFGLVQPKSCL